VGNVSDELRFSKERLISFQLVLSLVIRLLCNGLRVVVDITSRVRPILYSHAWFVFRKEIRKADDGTSIAIWNYNKIVLALGTSVWGINIAFLIQGKSLPASLTVGGPGIS
jgi:hypothetical protein